MNRRHFIATVTAALPVGASQARNKTTPDAASASGAAAGRVILVLGDSLSAEYGLPRGTGWVALLEGRLRRFKPAARVVNASISGDTTSGGRSRLPSLLAQHRPDVVIIELGSNDALRGLALELTADNLGWMTRASQQAGARVLLVGMQVPPNYGADYARRFARVFVDVAKASKAALVPFMLQGVADDQTPTRLFQADRLHPTQEAHPIILGNIWPELVKLVQ